MAGDIHSREEEGSPPSRRQPRPLDPESLAQLALSYVARYATSTAKLERYLARKLRERGWEDGGDTPPQAHVEALSARYAELGYVDDEAFARNRSDSLLRRGYGPRRVKQALGEAGIPETIRENVAPEAPERRAAALALARKRRFGPFGTGDRVDPKIREKQIAAMLRAGHIFADARALVDAPDIAAAQLWAEDDEAENF